MNLVTPILIVIIEYFVLKNELISVEICQNDNILNLMFPFDYIISYLSSFMTLKLGDIVDAEARAISICEHLPF